MTQPPFTTGTGSAEGAKRGLPVSAGTVNNDGGSVVHVARNSSSLGNEYPRALVRDCRDRMLDAFGQQSFVMEPGTRVVTIAAPPKETGVGSPTDGEARCLIIKPTSPAPAPAPRAPRAPPSPDDDWRIFQDINALFYPTKAANIHPIHRKDGLPIANAAGCLDLIRTNTSLTTCTIFAWSQDSSTCYCREDGVWEYVNQSGRTSGCVHAGPGAVKGCNASPAPSPGPPSPSPPPPGPQAVYVGSTAGQAGCRAAGNNAVWIADPVTDDGVYRIVNEHATLGKLCLAAEDLGSTPKGYTDMAQVVARPCYNASSNSSTSVNHK